MGTSFYNRNNMFIAIIAIFHLVGLLGFIFKPMLFMPLSSLNLLLSVVLILIGIGKFNWKLYAIIIAVSIFGFLIEVLGVKTGLIFGNYYYGNSFGLKLFSVPLLIGINWAFLLYSIAQFCIFKNKWINIILSSLLMVFLDYFIEQSASKYDFWYWHHNTIPLQNYIAWFLISLIINLFVQGHFIKAKNIIAKYFFVIQLSFFSLLYVIDYI